MRVAALAFGSDQHNYKQLLLQEFSGKNIDRVNVLTGYHDCLLFLLAYPESKLMSDLAAKELQRLAEVARLFMQEGNYRIREQLSGTGLAYTPVHVAFGFDIACWLVTKYAGEVSILEYHGDQEAIRQVLNLLLPEAEREDFQLRNESLSAFIRRCKGGSEDSDLQWLLHLFSQCDLKPELRDHLYDSLKLYITWSAGSGSPSRTFARSLKRPTYFHTNGLNRQPVPRVTMNHPIRKPYNLSSADKNELIDATRGILAMLERETDPSSYADIEDVMLFDMQRGVDIMLYPMTPDHRLPFDSYIGYTVFKNRLPVAYGGGWIFQQRCKIGINVLEAYRGGESAYLFLQVLRLYRQFYHLSRFIIEPYQIGHKNSEGIASGAFWFYYRLGFIPDTIELQQLAAREFEQVKTSRSYRSSVQVLKKLSHANMQLTCESEGHHLIDALHVSRLLSSMISKEFRGDRKLAISESVRLAGQWLELPLIYGSAQEAKRVAENFALLLHVLRINNWKPAELNALKQLILLKAAGSEHRYVRMFQDHRKLNEDLSAIAASVLIKRE